MIFSCKKTENCFSDSQTYEYALPAASGGLLDFFGTLGELRTNYKFRRPVFSCDLKNGVNIKGIIAEKIIKASFPDGRVDETKAELEKALAEYSSEDRADQ